MPALAKWAKENDESGVLVLTVNLDYKEEQKKAIASAAQEFSNLIAVGDPTQVVAELYHINSLPTIFLLDANGKILIRNEGYSEDSFRKITDLALFMAGQGQGHSRSQAAENKGGVEKRNSNASSSGRGLDSASVDKPCTCKPGTKCQCSVPVFPEIKAPQSQVEKEKPPQPHEKATPEDAQLTRLAQEKVNLDKAKLELDEKQIKHDKEVQEVRERAQRLLDFLKAHDGK